MAVQGPVRNRSDPSARIDYMTHVKFNLQLVLLERLIAKTPVDALKTLVRISLADRALIGIVASGLMCREASSVAILAPLRHREPSTTTAAGSKDSTK